jgi:hypothetical protein
MVWRESGLSQGMDDSTTRTRKILRLGIETQGNRQTTGCYGTGNRDNEMSEELKNLLAAEDVIWRRLCSVDIEGYACKKLEHAEKYLSGLIEEYFRREAV